MNLHRAQIEIAKDPHRFRVVNCGRRFGKTLLSIEEIKGKVLASEARICYLAPTFVQARDICWLELKGQLGELVINSNGSRLELEVRNLKGTSSFIYLRGWESVGTLRGQKFDFLVVDEVAMMRNFWLSWQEDVRPTLTDTQAPALFISTPKGFNHFYDLYNMENDPDKGKEFKSFTFTTYDNPHINKEEIDKARQELTEDRFAQEYLADFRKMEGLVYKEFNREMHTFNHDHALPEMKEYLCGVDFGFTNPSACVKIGVDGDNNFWVIEEWYKKEQTTNQIVEVVKQLKPHKVYADPAEPDRIFELKKAGMNCREVSKDIAAGIDTVREYFNQNRIKISKSCINLIAELESYRYPDSRPGHNENEIPVKEFDHALDSMRYVLHSYEPFVDTNVTTEFGMYDLNYN